LKIQDLIETVLPEGLSRRRVGKPGLNEKVAIPKYWIHETYLIAIQLSKIGCVRMFRMASLGNPSQGNSAGLVGSRTLGDARVLG
jgi:hypothetical protein